MTEGVTHDRTKNYFRQVKGSVLFKALAVAASFFAVPMMIQYLGWEQYGVWSTLLSIMSWVVFFDLGIGNGLRNKLAESLAKNRFDEAVGYISSGYTWIGIIALALFLFFAIFAFLIPWQTVFNTQTLSTAALRNAVLVSAFFVFFNFWLGLINQVLNAVQRASWVVLGQLISNVLGLIFVFVLLRAFEASILYMVASYGISIVFANVILSAMFYMVRRDLIPGLACSRRDLYPLLSIGSQFFVIQLAVLVIFTTDKLLITQFFGPEYVTQYDVVLKIFSVVTLIHGLLSAPLWSAYTDAYHRLDIAWIDRTIRKQLWLFLVFVLVILIFYFMANFIVRLWVGGSFYIPEKLVLAIAVSTAISIWNNVFGCVLGGIGKLRLGSIYTVLTATVNIPLSYYFSITLGMGISGIVFGTVASIAISAIISPIQVYYFIYAKRKNNTLSHILR